MVSLPFFIWLNFPFLQAEVCGGSCPALPDICFPSCSFISFLHDLRAVAFFSRVFPIAPFLSWKGTLHKSLLKSSAAKVRGKGGS